ncbi:GIY-YIG nuclease family protein [Fusobacterium perfoetens]|uniref:GIY-YIG nuclease family protein n=1 Tax=Fusobacterium perfoetens TaxID=852 RepID=UPI00048A2992|nr:GIY-YIG nuclease family protein [Fusobacterium perfoetens]
MKIQQIFNELTDLNDMNYRFHLAKPASERPSDVLARSREDWLGWQIYKERENGERFPYPVKYIFSFAQLSGNEFIFGGIFEILDRSGKEYKVKYVDKYQDLIGRVVLTYTGKNKRGTVFRPSHILENSEIIEIYKSAYKGEKFPGIENINHTYKQLRIVYDNKLEDWKNILSNIKGIYLLTDTKTGKHYVGSAKGVDSIYGRWSNYIYGFDGGNKELIKLRKEEGEEYFKENFKFSILEVFGMSFEDKNIEAKESLWKEKLMSRQFGYNSN